MRTGDLPHIECKWYVFNKGAFKTNTQIVCEVTNLQDGFLEFGHILPSQAYVKEVDQALRMKPALVSFPCSVIKFTWGFEVSKPIPHLNYVWNLKFCNVVHSYLQIEKKKSAFQGLAA